MNNLLRQSERLQSVPRQQLQHSTFRIPYGHTTTCNFGDLVPFYFSEVLPGSTFEVTTNMLARMSTPLFPVMGNANIDYYYFFVPNRLVWDHWANFCGENTEGAWAPSVSYEIPHMKVTPSRGDCYDHFGIKPGVEQDIGVLPLRAYRLIWNEWFRDENVQDPKLVNRGDTETDNTYAAMCKVNRYPDLFSTALPAPQKGQPADIPFYGLVSGNDAYSAVNTIGQRHSTNESPLTWVFGSGTDHGQGFTSGGNHAVGVYFDKMLSEDAVGPYGGVTILSESNGVGNPKSPSNLRPDNLYVSNNEIAEGLSVSAVNFTVNQLREAFATQRVLEAFARVGSRYTEMLRGIFNTISPDARLQRPEYLGGDRVRIEMQQVLQTSSTDDTSPQGNTAAFSKTVTGGKNFTHTFTEHGIVIGVMAARVLHVYQDGLEKYWSKRDFFDFYLPQLAHIGEQPIRNREIFVQGNENDNGIFGFQEAWYEYRFKPSQVTGAFRSGDNSLDAWHYADNYSRLPTLSGAWLEEGTAEVDRTLAVSSALSDQLLIDIYQINDATLPLPVFSVPGLIDHF